MLAEFHCDRLKASKAYGALCGGVCCSCDFAHTGRW